MSDRTDISRVFEPRDPAHYKSATFWRIVSETMRPGLQRFVLRTLRIRTTAASMADAEDLTQTAFMTVFAKLDSARIAGLPNAEDRRRVVRSYLYTAAFRHAVRHTLKSLAERQIIATVANLDEFCLEEQVERDQGPVRRTFSLEDLQAFVTSLSERDRLILYWHHVAGMPWSDVAVQLGDGTSAQALRVHACRLLRRLRKSARATGFVVVLKEKRS